MSKYDIEVRALLDAARPTPFEGVSDIDIKRICSELIARFPAVNAMAFDAMVSRGGRVPIPTPYIPPTPVTFEPDLESVDAALDMLDRMRPSQQFTNSHLVSLCWVS